VSKKYTWLLIITLANVDRFTKFVHYQIPEKIFVHIRTPLCFYTTLWNLKITIAADFNGSYIALFYILCIYLKALRHGSQFYLQIHNACFSFVSVHQMAPPLQLTDIQLQLTTHLSTPKEWKAKLAWLFGGLPLAYISGRFTHISGHPSATGRAQDRKSSPCNDRRSTAVPRNQLA